MIPRLSVDEMRKTHISYDDQLEQYRGPKKPPMPMFPSLHQVPRLSFMAGYC